VQWYAPVDVCSGGNAGVSPAFSLRFTSRCDSDRGRTPTDEESAVRLEPLGDAIRRHVNFSRQFRRAHFEGFQFLGQGCMRIRGSETRYRTSIWLIENYSDV
jgi:hypothetical protein